MRQRPALFVCLLLLLTACITVKNYGGFWDTAKLDPALEGEWKSTRATGNGANVTFTPDDRNYRMQFSTRPDYQLVRTLTVGESTYLMTKRNESDEGGTLMPYVIQGQTLALFAPNRDKQKDFLKRYPNIPFKITKTSFTIEELNPETMKWLVQISSEPEWWISMQEFSRGE